MVVKIIAESLSVSDLIQFFVSTQTHEEPKKVDTQKYAIDKVVGKELSDSSNDKSARYYYSGWSYTNLAVGVNVFSSLVNVGISAAVAFVASIFGIGAAAAGFLLEYMGASGLSMGTAIAKKLDTSGNGWIGLYTRGCYVSKGGSLVRTEHKTM